MLNNKDRAEAAAETIEYFQLLIATDDEDAIPDFLCDLLHHCYLSDIDFNSELLRARGHFQIELEKDC